MPVRPSCRRPTPRPFALAVAVSLVACLSAGPVAAQRSERAAPAAPAPVQKDVPYVPTPQELVDRMLEMAKVTDKDVVYDLGCGDGRMVVTAAKKYGARGVGVDIDPERIAESNQNAKAAGVTDKVKFIQDDLFKMEFDEATVLTLYLLPSVNAKLRPKILELKPGTRVVSHAFDMGDWQPDHKEQVEGRTAYFWVVPAKVEGQWQATVKDGGQERRVALTLRQQHQRVSGTAEVDGRRTEIKDAKLDGDVLTFALATDGKAAKTYTCRVDGGTMQTHAGARAGGGADAGAGADAELASFVAKRQGENGERRDPQQQERGAANEQRQRQPAGAN